MTAELITPAEFVTIGEGPKNRRTDPESGLSFYSWQGRELVSVTTIRRLAGIPFNLSQWQLNQVIGRAVTDFETLQAMLTRERKPRERVLEKNRQKEASTWLRAAATEERDLAAELGTAVHDAAARGLPLADADLAVVARLAQYLDWLEKSEARIIATEFQVFNLTEGYAGTVDLLVDFPNRTGAGRPIWLLDLKTGKGAYSEHALQLIDYRTAEFVGVDDVKDARLTTLLHAVDGMAILHLSDEGWEFRAIRYDRETLEASRGLLKFSKWMHANSRVEDVTVGLRKGGI